MAPVKRTFPPRNLEIGICGRASERPPPLSAVVNGGGVGGGRVFEVQSFAQDKKLDLLSRVCRIRTIAAAIIALCKYGEGCSLC